MTDLELRIIQLIRTLDDDELVEELEEFHASDIADAFEGLEQYELDHLYEILPNEFLSQIFTYLEEPAEYVDDMDNEQVADIIEEMDADDAVDFLEELSDSETLGKKDLDEITELIEPEAKEDIELIHSYEDDEVGSKMTTNFITVKRSMTVKKMMRQVIKDAAENDNINIIYALNDDETYYGIIFLRDLICARPERDTDDITLTTYPVLHDKQKMEEVSDILQDYDLDSIAVLNDANELIGIITTSDILESIEEEAKEDYAKLAGISEPTEVDETLWESIKKRIPWLMILLVLGLFISMLTSSFEAVVIQLTTIVFFQSLILDMSGNVGTQSLAVTITALDEDEVKPFKIIGKEVLTGLMNGLIIGIGAFLVILGFLSITNHTWNETFKTAFSVGISMITALTLSSFTGSAIPLLLTKLKIDPATASGPFITTINDILAVLIYYGLASLLFFVL